MAVLTLVGQPGRIFCEQEPLQCMEDGADKGSEKKAAKTNGLFPHERGVNGL